MTKKEVQERDCRLKPQRAYALIVYDRNKPDVIYGFNPKYCNFRRYAATIYSYRGKQKSKMLATLYYDLKCCKKYNYNGLPKMKKSDIVYEIVHLSSENCKYLAVKPILNSWYPAAAVYPRKMVIDYFAKQSKTEKDAVINHVKAVRNTCALQYR